MLARTLITLLATAAGLALAQEYDVVETPNGAIRGLDLGQSRSFRGIPYGQPPVGQLRFASPRPALPWAPAVVDALAPGNICPGGNSQSLIGLVPRVDVNEDCLYLNVYAPSRERLTKPLPVMFWIYGGAFVLGDGWEVGAYDGTYLASTRDVIIVTHNYRLGAFGFLVSPEGRGNYALEDQRLALQWVIDNIANFGGDPSRITIFGESAGAMSVAAHMVSPPSFGMFQAAIVQSDPFTLATKSRTAALEIGQRVAENVNCTFDLACLRTKSMREIISAGNVGVAGRTSVLADLLTWVPTIDGFNQIVSPLDGFQSGAAVDVPFIVGTNTDEIVLFQDIIDAVLKVVSLLIGEDLSVDLYENEYRLLVNAVFKEKGPDVLARYPPLPNNASNYDQFVTIVTLYTFECSTRQAVVGFSETHSSPVYSYRFNHIPQFLPIIGRFISCFGDSVCHALEMPYTWHIDTLALVDRSGSWGRVLAHPTAGQAAIIPVASRFTPEEEAMSQAMIGYWTGLASGKSFGWVCWVTSGLVAHDRSRSPGIVGAMLALWFVTIGNINNNAAVTWPRLNGTEQQLLILQTDIKPGVWNRATCDFWDTVGYKY